MGELNNKGLDVLMLTASYGGGHVQAAKALTLGLHALNSQFNIEMLDYVRWINTSLDYLTRLAYVKVTSKTPRLWHLLYDITDRPFFTKYSFIGRVGFHRLYNYLIVKKPKVVVSTHFLTSAVVGEMKKRGLLDVPLVSVITDNSLHALWLHKYVDLYLVGNDNIKDALVEQGIGLDRVMVTGIPIDVKFNHNYAKQPLRSKNGLEGDMPTILVMSGAYGMGDITGICNHLANFPQKIQVIVVTGRDVRLKNKIIKLTKGSKNKFHILGFVTNVFELMALADLLISKAGGLTTSEALASNLPMLIYRPIPGQEEGNAEYLARSGAAVIANSMEQFEKLFAELVANEEILIKMTTACSKVKKPLAAIRGSELLLQKYINKE